MNRWGIALGRPRIGAVCEKCGHVGMRVDPVLVVPRVLVAGELYAIEPYCQSAFACHDRQERKKKEARQ